MVKPYRLSPNKKDSRFLNGRKCTLLPVIFPRFFLGVTNRGLKVVFRVDAFPSFPKLRAFNNIDSGLTLFYARAYLSKEKS